MVHEANLKQATAEKQLKEALGKVSYSINKNRHSATTALKSLLKSQCFDPMVFVRQR